MLALLYLVLGLAVGAGVVYILMKRKLRQVQRNLEIMMVLKSSWRERAMTVELLFEKMNRDRRRRESGF
jgi:hypothetical protein